MKKAHKKIVSILLAAVSAACVSACSCKPAQIIDDYVKVNPGVLPEKNANEDYSVMGFLKVSLLTSELLFMGYQDLLTLDIFFSFVVKVLYLTFQFFRTTLRIFLPHLLSIESVNLLSI